MNKISFNEDGFLTHLYDICGDDIFVNDSVRHMVENIIDYLSENCENEAVFAETLYDILPDCSSISARDILAYCAMPNDKKFYEQILNLKPDEGIRRLDILAITNDLSIDNSVNIVKVFKNTYELGKVYLESADIELTQIPAIVRSTLDAAKIGEKIIETQKEYYKLPCGAVVKFNKKVFHKE